MGRVRSKSASTIVVKLSRREAEAACDHIPLRPGSTPTPRCACGASTKAWRARSIISCPLSVGPPGASVPVHVATVGTAGR